MVIAVGPNLPLIWQKTLMTSSLPEHREVCASEVEAQDTVLAGLADVQNLIILSQGQARRVGKAIESKWSDHAQLDIYDKNRPSWVFD